MNCPKCGFIMLVSRNPQGNEFMQCNNCGTVAPMKKKTSSLGVLGFILSLTCCLSPIGLIISIINLATNKDSKKGLSIVGTIIGGLITISMIVGIATGNDEKIKDKVINQGVQIEKGTEKDDSEVLNNESEKKEDDNYVKVGDSFTKDGIKITVNSYDDNYVDNDSYWYKPKDGMTYIRVEVTFENTNDNGSEYVGNEDFNLYVDNEAIEDDFFIGDDSKYLVELSSGRKVTSSIYFQVPKDCKSIELEYSKLLMKNPIIIKLK